MAVKDGGSYVDVVSTTSLNAENWYHIAATYDSLNLKVYINGVLENSVQNSSGVYPSPGVDARIGCQRQSDGIVRQLLNGKLDEMKFYTYALSADSVAAHYRAVVSNPHNDSVPVLVPMVPRTQTNRKPVFRWHPAPGASSYRIVIDTAGDFMNPVVLHPLPDTAFTPQVDLPYGKIFWKVSASTDFTRYSPTDTFTLIAVTGNAMQCGLRDADAVQVRTSGRGVHLTYSVSERARVKIQLFSMTGICMVTLCDKESASGTSVLQWNGTDNNGSVLPRGSYLVRCAIGSTMVTRKIALVR
jgi:hypothetical protein